MSDNIFEPMPEAPLGTFPGIITDVSVENMSTKYGDKVLVKWIGTVTDENGQDYAIDALTSTSTRKGSRAHAWLKALGLDPSEPISKEALVGRSGLFVLVEDDAGYTKLGDIVPAPKQRSPIDPG